MKNKRIPNKSILSIDYDDDQKGYDDFNQFLNKHTERQKRKTASEIIEMGEQFLSEIDHKKKIKEEEKRPLVKYIIKKSNKYSERYLLDLDFNDVKDIYDELKYENRSLLKRVMEFLFPSKN